MDLDLHHHVTTIEALLLRQTAGDPVMTGRATQIVSRQGTTNVAPTRTDPLDPRMAIPTDPACLRVILPSGPTSLLVSRIFRLPSTSSREIALLIGEDVAAETAEDAATAGRGGSLRTPQKEHS